MKVAVVGAGLAGLIVARQLQTVADVTVFEKSRGVGGRMATRYAGEFEFDHGAQFFTARSDAFRTFLQPLIDDGAIADWQARFAEFDRTSIESIRSWGDDYPHYVGAPRMNSIGRFLSSNLNITLNAEITAIRKDRNGWTVSDSKGNLCGPFDWLVLTPPAPQTAVLAEAYPDLVAFCRERSLVGCFALMLGFATPIELQWQAALVRNADISWISVNCSKPGRNSSFTLVVQSTNTWAQAHIDDDPKLVIEHLLDEALQVTGVDLRSAGHCQLHRWRYANIGRQNGPMFFLDEEAQLAACGDWCVRGRVEAAFSSANDLAKFIAAAV